MKIDELEILIIALISFIVGCLIGLVSFQIIVTDPLRAEAIQKGYATWEVTNQSTGETQFRFK